MRTTLTLDDDVAAALEHRRRARGTRMRDEVNDVLRAGLAADELHAAETDDYEAPTLDPGRPLVVDPRELREMLDDEDVTRGLPARS